MPSISFRPRCVSAAVLLFAVITSTTTLARDSEPKWIRVSSAHFAVLTDAGEKKGREVSLRLEQMRDVFGQLFLKTKVQMPEPLDVIALQSDEEYIRVAPLRQGRPISAPGFFLSREDRNYIVLDLAAEDSWRAVSHDFARLFLSFNYPATQDWFDEGFAQYFSSLKLGDNQAQIGSDPAPDLSGNQGPAQIFCGIAEPAVAGPAGIIHHAPGPFRLPAHVLRTVVDRDALPAQPEQIIGDRNLFRTGADSESPG